MLLKVCEKTITKEYATEAVWQQSLQDLLPGLLQRTLANSWRIRRINAPFPYGASSLSSVT